MQELDLFRKSEQLFNVAAVHQEVVQPTYFSSTWPGSIQFDIGAKDTLYTSPHMDLVMQLKIKKKSATGVVSNLENTDDVSLLNNSLFSLFSSVDVTINDVLVETSNGHFPYLSFIKNLLTTTQSQKTNYLEQLAGWEPDKPALSMDSPTGNTGRTKRKNRSVGSKLVVFNSTLPLDITSCSKLFVPGLKFSIRLTHNADTARLHSERQTHLKYHVEVNIRKY